MAMIIALIYKHEEDIIHGMTVGLMCLKSMPCANNCILGVFELKCTRITNHTYTYNINNIELYYTYFVLLTLFSIVNHFTNALNLYLSKLLSFTWSCCNKRRYLI